MKQGNYSSQCTDSRNREAKEELVTRSKENEEWKEGGEERRKDAEMGAKIWEDGNATTGMSEKSVTGQHNGKRTL